MKDLALKTMTLKKEIEEDTNKCRYLLHMYWKN